MTDWFCFCGRSYAGNRERCECSLPLLSRAEADRLSPDNLQRLRDAVIGRARAQAATARAAPDDDAMWTPTSSWFAVRDEAHRRLANLACAVTAAALEELRARAAERRIDERWGHVLREARMRMPIGGRR